MTLMETLLAMGIVALMAGTLYSGLVWGMSEVKMAQEDLRATQVMMEKLEVLRAYTWSQLSPVADPDELEDPTDPFDPEDPHTVEDDPVYNVSVPTTFSAPVVAGTTNGPLFNGTISFEPAPVSEAYSNSLIMVKVSLSWQSGSHTRSRTMKTFFAQFGMQNNLTR